MTYTIEYATLKAKTDLIEHIIYQISAREDIAKRHRNDIDENPDEKWYKEQLQNTQLEIQAYESIMKQLAK